MDTIGNCPNCEVVRPCSLLGINIDNYTQHLSCRVCGCEFEYCIDQEVLLFKNKVNEIIFNFLEKKEDVGIEIIRSLNPTQIKDLAIITHKIISECIDQMCINSKKEIKCQSS